MADDLNDLPNGGALQFSATSRHDIPGRGTVFGGPAPFDMSARLDERAAVYRQPWRIDHPSALHTLWRVTGIETSGWGVVKQGGPVALVARPWTDADAAGQPRRERIVEEALADMPEPWPSNRVRGPREQGARHLHALRARLDFLVRQEEEYGEQQRGVHHHRAERNALIWALQTLGAIAQELPPPPMASKGPDPAHVRDLRARLADLQSQGFTRVDERQPGVLLHARHEDAAGLQVPMPIWFYMLARVGAVGWPVERGETLAALRRACEEFGDNDWPDTLHLADVIDKHLVRHLEEPRDGN